MKRLSASIVAVLALLGSTVAPASGARNDTTFAASNCAEGVLLFFLDPEVVRPFVPERFEIALITTTPPQAELAVATTSCEDVTSGKASGPSFFSEVGIYIEAVDASPGYWHYYGLWHATTHKELARSLSRMGITAPYVKDASSTSTTGTADMSASVPWRRASYDVQMVTPGPMDLFALRSSVWWYSAGDDRYVRVIYAVEPENEITSGAGTLETSVDSPIAQMLGTTSRLSDAAYIARYDSLTATVSRVKL